jgi:hypothetical protein
LIAGGLGRGWAVASAIAEAGTGIQIQTLEDIRAK